MLGFEPRAPHIIRDSVPLYRHHRHIAAITTKPPGAQANERQYFTETLTAYVWQHIFCMAIHQRD